MAVTFFADLGHTKNHISDIDHHSYRQRTEINAFYHQVFPESTIFYLSTPFIKLLYLIVRQKTYLTVPFTGMCISFNTKIFQKMSLWNRVFFHTFFLTGTDRFYNAFWSSFSSYLHFILSSN